MNPATAPDDRQLDNIRAELHAIVDRCVDDWPTIRRQSREMGRGFASGSGLGPSGAGGDPVGGVASSSRPDPVAAHLGWLRAFSVFVVTAYELESKRVGVLGSVKEKAPSPASEICPECGVLVTKGKRLDGALYHNGSDDDPVCWRLVYDRTRGRRGGPASFGALERDDWTAGRHLGAAQFEAKREDGAA